MPEEEAASDIPGGDPDPHDEVAERIKVGWTIVGIALSLGTASFFLKQAGILFSMPRTLLQSARDFAVLISFINIGVWMYWPLDDLKVLRCWVHTQKKIFPHHTAECWAIILTTVLLLSLFIATSQGSIFFGAVGVGVYLWNLLGFAMVRAHVVAAIDEARRIYNKQPEPKRQILLDAITAVEKHWSCESLKLLGGWQQRRHLTMVVAFICVAVLGSFRGALRESLAYSLGAFTIVIGEITIAVRRTARDLQLRHAEERLRELRLRDDLQS